MDLKVELERIMQLKTFEERKKELSAITDKLEKEDDKNVKVIFSKKDADNISCNQKCDLIDKAIDELENGDVLVGYVENRSCNYRSHYLRYDKYTLLNFGCIWNIIKNSMTISNVFQNSLNKDCYRCFSYLAKNGELVCLKIIKKK